MFHVLGEVLSFYLSRLLGLDNVPAVVLSVTSDDQWSEQDLDKLEWQKNQLVALIQWIPNMNTFRLEKVYIEVLQHAKCSRQDTSD